MPAARSDLVSLMLSALLFSVMGLLAKMAGRRLPSQEIVMVRSAIALAICVGMLARAGVRPWGRRKGLLVLRGLLGFGALSCFFYSVVHLPLAEATVIQYTSPIFTAMLAAVLLGEKASWRVIGALACGLAGVALIARPGFLFGTASPYAPRLVAIAFLGALLAAGAYVAVRKLAEGDGEHELVIVFYFALVSVPASIPPMAPVALWPDLREWGLLLGVGVSAQLAQVYLTRGLSHVPAASATVVLYLQIVFAAVLGAVVLAEIPEPWTVGGAVLILGGTLLVATGRRPAGTVIPAGSTVPSPPAASPTGPRR